MSSANIGPYYASLDVPIVLLDCSPDNIELVTCTNVVTIHISVRFAGTICKSIVRYPKIILFFHRIPTITQLYLLKTFLVTEAFTFQIPFTNNFGFSLEYHDINGYKMYVLRKLKFLSWIYEAAKRYVYFIIIQYIFRIINYQLKAEIVLFPIVTKSLMSRISCC